MSPRSPAALATQRAESRARILDAALELFSRHGYESTSVRMIAGHAGVAQGLLYNYFPGKEALLGALFEQSMRDVRASWERAEAAGPGAGGPVERLVRAAFAAVREHERFWRLSYAVRYQTQVLHGLGEALPAWAAEIHQRLERYLAAEGAADPATEALALFALIDGAAQHYVLDPERYPLDAVADLIVDHYRRLLPGGAVAPTSGRSS